MNSLRVRRRALANLLGAALVPAMAPIVSLAQPGKPPQVIWLVKRQVDGSLKPMQTEQDVRAAFTALGLVEGRDLMLTFAEIPNLQDGSGERPFSTETEAFIARIIQSRPAAIVTLARPELGLLTSATRDVPIVFYNLAADPSMVGMVESLRRPGGNVTGTHVGWSDIQTRQWQLLKELVPSMKRGGMLFEKVPKAYRETDRGRVMEQAVRETMRLVSSRFQFEVVDVEISSGAPEEEVVEALRKARVEGVLVGTEMTPQILSALKRLKLPACGGLVRNVRRGLLMGITFDFSEGERYAAAIVARILKGEPPSTIPVYRTTKYYLYLNRTTARAIDITFPASILIQAEEVVD